MGKESGKDSNSDDSALFRQAVQDIKPLAPKRVHRQEPRPRPKANRRREDERAALRESLDVPAADADIETGEELAFRRNGIAERDFRKLRRGGFRVQAAADLHGLTEAAAREELQVFLAEAVAEGARCVRIVHGKGLNSGTRGPVIKTMVNRELRRWDAVLAFCSAQPRDGGTGAAYVLLRRR